MNRLDRAIYPIYFLVMVLTISTPNIYSIELPYFYHAAYFPGEPRFEKPWLSSVDFIVASGRAQTGRNSCSQKTELLDIYGTHNMQAIGKNVEESSNTKVNDIIKKLADINSQSPFFAHLSFHATFKETDLIFNFYQNFINGFFCQATFAFKSLSLDPIFHFDLSKNANSLATNDKTVEWKNFLNNFDDILSAYNLCFKNSIKKSGLDDTSLWAGWTRNYQETEILDFIDFTIKAGALFPTGKKRNENILFDLPLGYNGHFGFQIFTSASLGLYDWLTIGTHSGATIFSDAQQSVRIKTSPEQSGLIKLAKQEVNIHQGPVWSVGAYIKADHIPNPLSIILGYTFAQKNRNALSAPSFSNTLPDVINSDATLLGWQMHTLHLIIEYDFTQRDQFIGPRIAFILNNPLTGKNIFNTKMIGFDAGIELSWEF